MWTHEIAQTEDPADGPVEYEELSIGDWIDLEVVYEPDGRFYVQSANECGDYVNLGWANSLEEGQRTAEKWALAQIAEMLKALGAEGIWLLRGAGEAQLKYRFGNWRENDMAAEIALEPPNERLMLIRFPTGDGGEAGIEYL